MHEVCYRQALFNATQKLEWRVVKHYSSLPPDAWRDSVYLQTPYIFLLSDEMATFIRILDLGLLFRSYIS